MTQAEFDRAIELAKGGCTHIYGLQQEALRKKYSVVATEDNERAEEAN